MSPYCVLTPATVLMMGVVGMAMVNVAADVAAMLALSWSTTRISAVVVLRSAGTLQPYSPASGTSVAIGVKLPPPLVERRMSTPPASVVLLQVIFVVPPPCTVPEEGATLLIDGAGLTRRMTLLSVSAMYRLPWPSPATPSGWDVLPAVAGPLSPM